MPAQDPLSADVGVVHGASDSLLSKVIRKKNIQVDSRPQVKKGQ